MRNFKYTRLRSNAFALSYTGLSDEAEHRSNSAKADERELTGGRIKEFPRERKAKDGRSLLCTRLI